MFFRRKMFKKRNKAVRRTIKICLVLIVSAILFFHYDNSITDIIVGIAIKNAENKISNCTNKVVNDYLSDADIQYSDIITREKNDENVSSIFANTPNLNRIKSKIVVLVEKELSKYNCLETVVQLGSLSGLNVFSNRGPDIHILYDLYCTTSAEFTSEFSSAGLNQTCHTISINISIKYCLVLNDGDHVSTVNNDFIVAETVIVGDVPSAYGSIYGLTAKD